MNKLSRLLTVIFISSTLVSACAKETEFFGGMSVSYATEKTDLEYLPLSKKIPETIQLQSASVTDSSQPWNWAMGGTESSDLRFDQIPFWIDFKWKESPLAVRFQSGPSQSDEIADHLKSLPIKEFRVLVRERIPADVIGELVAAQKVRRKNELADKALQLEFRWIGDQVKFGWHLSVKQSDGRFIKARSGGDLFS